ncbi:MAG TPA: dihydropteroate synthase [Candidatus Polarisedimenticolia bacterium]|nr:dihydropteroate synthase [Candidatus Polarisedimenticolia bacterium]
MTPRAFLIRSLVPTVGLAHDAEDLGLYAAAAARSWSHFPHMLRVDGLTTPQVAALREKARLLRIQVAESMPYRHGEDWSEGLVISADTVSLSSLARDISISYASVGRALSELLAALAQRTRRLHFRSGDLVLDRGAGGVLMGVLNVTPDSFADGGRHEGVEGSVEHGLRLAADGAAIVDVGGESTRPGAAPVSVEEELARTIPVVKKLRDALPAAVIVSIDTMKSEVARAAVDAGAELINDVSGLSADPAMRAAAASLGVHVVLNHMRGTPRTMQNAPSYRHVIPEVIADLSEAAEAARQEGIDPEKILIDPGIGFGKRLADNLAILRHLAAFASLGRPVVVGISRKSFLGKLVPDEGADSVPRGDATLAAEACAMLAGAHIVRTHDPARAARAGRVAGAISGYGAAAGDEASSR